MLATIDWSVSRYHPAGQQPEQLINNVKVAERIIDNFITIPIRLSQKFSQYRSYGFLGIKILLIDQNKKISCIFSIILKLLDFNIII